MGENIDNFNLGSLLGNLGDLKLDNIIEVFGDLGDQLSENVENRLAGKYLKPILDNTELIIKGQERIATGLDKLVAILKKK